MALRLCFVFLGTTFGLLVAQPQQSPIRAKTEDGQQVLLMPDGRWQYEAKPRIAVSDSTTKPGKAAPRSSTKLPYGDVVFQYDASKWSQSKPDGGRINYTHKTGKLLGSIISENFGGIPTSAMKEVALANARRLDPNLRLIKEERRSVRGRELLYLEFEATQSGLLFTFKGYYHGGTQSDLQIIAYTLSSEAAGLDGEIQDFLNGIEVREQSTPEDRSAPKTSESGIVSFGNFKLNYNRDLWTARQNGGPGNWLLSDKSGTIYANLIAEDVQIPLNSLLEIALDTMHKQDPLARVLGEEDRTISGVTVRSRRIDLTPRGIPLTYFCYYYGGDSGAVQLLTWTSRQAFDAKKAEMEELLNGLVIEKPKE